MKKVRSTYSQCPFQLRMYKGDLLLSTGTAFFYAHNDEWFIITNWHNLSGRHFLSKEPLSGPECFPTHICANWATSILETSFTTMLHRLEIYSDYEPIWYEHPELGSDCDVVAIPIEKPTFIPQNLHNAANLIGKLKIPIRPGGLAFIIGFPRSLSVYFGLPIWKSGYIASEPAFDVTIGGELFPMGGMIKGKDIPAFFLDTQTREGMSGAPVFASYTGWWNLDSPYEDIEPESKDFWSKDNIAMAATAVEFVGCYGGRVGKEEEGAALGLCWSLEAINMICDSKVLGKHPHLI